MTCTVPHSGHFALWTWQHIFHFTFTCLLQLFLMFFVENLVMLKQFRNILLCMCTCAQTFTRRLLVLVLVPAGPEIILKVLCLAWPATDLNLTKSLTAEGWPSAVYVRLEQLQSTTTGSWVPAPNVRLCLCKLIDRNYRQPPTPNLTRQWTATAKIHDKK